MTESRARALCAKWQKLLRLEDWDITVSIVRRHAMPSGLAEASFDPADIDPDAWEADRDLEISLVHELVHVAFEYLGPPKPLDTLEGRATERAIERLAVALVGLDRRDPAVVA